MSSQIDYVIAIGVFLSAFLFITTFVTNYSSSSLDALRTTSLRESALAILNSVERNSGGSKITELGLGTEAYSFQIRVSNSGSAKNDSSQFRLSDVGYQNADKNSVTIYDGDHALPYVLTGDFFSFNAEVPAGGKTVIVWFDDDSNFITKATSIPLFDDVLPSSLQHVERSRVVQYKLLQDLSLKSYSSVKEDFDFRIVLVDLAGSEHFNYGGTPPQVTVVALQRPALFQTRSGSVVKGYMIAEVWA